MDSTDFSSEKYTTTPLKSEGTGVNGSRRQINDRGSSNQYKTPVRCNESIFKRGKIPKSSSFKRMPIYSPPTNIVGVVKNPFEQAWCLKERLSQPFCSPSLFEKVSSPAKQSDQFSWSIEDISILRPAPINENPSQEFDSWFSPATENEAQKAINKFFSSQVVNLASPVNVVKQQHSFNSDRSGKTEKETTDTWSQTVLTFPPNLPPEIEKLLSTYCTFTENQFNQDDDDLNSSSGSVSRKKLSFESSIDEEDSLCKTPVHVNNKCIKQTVASTPISKVLTSPELSPITMDKFQDSPMDVSVSFRSKGRISMMNDVTMNDKENLKHMSWNQNSMGTINSVQSSDSAFSSIE